MEMQLIAKSSDLPKPIVKQEMDQSVKANDESGVFSNHSMGNSTGEWEKGEWICFENEISDPSKFNPPILYSAKPRKIPACNISSIEGNAGIGGNSIYAKGDYKKQAQTKSLIRMCIQMYHTIQLVLARMVV